MMTCPVTEGDVLCQKFLVERRIGSGGMGTVVAAQHQQLGHRVAIKLMHPELNGTEFQSRFLREGRIVARLRSPHVARVLDVGLLDSGGAYLVMEYLEGCDLEKILAQRGALPLGEAVDYLLQACEAIAEAHAAGIVHRDLKPENLFLTNDSCGRPCVKVLDFGISKLAEAGATDEPAITTNSLVIGTPLYMPPEQMRGAHEVDGRADIWALGVILYELVTGKPAWSGSTLSEVCVRVASDPTPLARSLEPGLPPGVDDVIATCLQKDPRNRFQTVVELAQALASLCPEIGVPALDRMRQLLFADVACSPAARDSSTPESSSNAPRVARATPNQGTNTAWAGHEVWRGSEGARRVAPLSWKLAPALILALVGVIAGVAWAHRDGFFAMTSTEEQTGFMSYFMSRPQRGSVASGAANALPNVVDAHEFAGALPTREAVSPVSLVVPVEHVSNDQSVGADQASAPKVSDLPLEPSAPLPKPKGVTARAEPQSTFGTTVGSNRQEKTPQRAGDLDSLPDWGGRK